MFEKEIQINNGFKEWLGEKPIVGDIVVIFGISITATIILIINISAELSKLSLWQNIIYAVVAFDIIGGAIANFTISARRYYTKNANKRWMFFAEHIAHITLFYIATESYLFFWVSIFIYTMICGIAVNLIRSTRVQELVASSLVAVGCIIFYSFYFLTPLTSWFPAVFMIKIILGFSVKRNIEE